MYVSPILRPVSGLTQALAFNAAELDKQQRQLQARTLLKSLGPGLPGPALPEPLAYAPHPEAMSWQRNVQGFLRQYHAPVASPNPYNNHAFFTHAPVLRSGWAETPAHSSFGVAPGRSDCGPPNVALVKRFRLLLEVSGFDRRFPVLLDRNGYILDGLHRLLACAQMGERYFFLQLDF